MISRAPLQSGGMMPGVDLRRECILLACPDETHTKDGRSPVAGDQTEINCRSSVARAARSINRAVFGARLRRHRAAVLLKCAAVLGGTLSRGAG
jgi:hypothetical protein